MWFRRYSDETQKCEEPLNSQFDSAVTEHQTRKQKRPGAKEDFSDFHQPASRWELNLQGCIMMSTHFSSPGYTGKIHNSLRQNLRLCIRLPLFYQDGDIFCPPCESHLLYILVFILFCFKTPLNVPSGEGVFVDRNIGGKDAGMWFDVRERRLT